METVFSQLHTHVPSFGYHSRRNFDVDFPLEVPKSSPGKDEFPSGGGLKKKRPWRERGWEKLNLFAVGEKILWSESEDSPSMGGQLSLRRV